MNNAIIVFNAGSSSLKFSLFSALDYTLLFRGIVDDIQVAPQLSIHNAGKELIYEGSGIAVGYKSAVNSFLKWYEGHNDNTIIAAGHRVVHGGREFSRPVKISNMIMGQLEELVPLAPLHQPYNLETIRAFTALYPSIPQVACFDTAFHRTQLPEAENFALPRSYAEEGIIRYGFHGLSYEYIASVLPDYMGAKANGRIIVAHIGNGASMCAINNGKSVATTMGFTALDGLMMGTRCGNIDPGVLLYLMEARGMTATEVGNLLYKESGLKGVSGISNNMRVLLESRATEATEAINMFCYQAAKYLAGLIPVLGGLDAIVFTAGIGEGAPAIRNNICNRLSWLGTILDDKANNNQQNIIHSPQSRVGIYMIPTNEELVIARQVLAYR